MKKPTLCPKCGGKTIPKNNQYNISYTCTNCGHTFTKKKKDIMNARMEEQQPDTRANARKRLTPEDRERIVKLYKNMRNGGMSTTKAQYLIARDCHHSKTTVFKTLKQNGLIKTRGKKEPEPNSTDESVPHPNTAAPITSPNSKSDCPKSKDSWKEFIMNISINEYINLKGAMEEIDGFIVGKEREEYEE